LVFHRGWWRQIDDEKVGTDKLETDDYGVGTDDDDDDEVGIDDDDEVETDDGGGGTGDEGWSAKTPNLNVIGIFSMVSFGI